MSIGATVSGRVRGAVGPADLVLRIVAAPKMVAPETLGSSMVDLQGAAGTLATVYSDRVAALSMRAGADGGKLLGRAVAHEIGHLLMGTSRHSSFGLMRARWLDREVSRDVSADWAWSRADVDAIHWRLLARLREPIQPEGLLAAMAVSLGPVTTVPTTCHMGKCVSK